MKKFIFEILSVFIVVSILLYIIQFVIDNKASKCYTRYPYPSFNYIYQQQLDADIVIFGNSRAECGYNTMILDTILYSNCFNLGFAGYSFDYIYNLQILPYLEKNIQPKLIILDIGPQAFLEHYNDHFQKEFLPFLRYSCFNFYISICDEVDVWDKYLPTKYYGMNIKELNVLLQGMDVDTNYLHYKDCFREFKIGKYRINFPHNVYELERDCSIINELKKFIQFIKERNIPVLFVCSPMHKLDFYDKCQMNEFWNLMDTIAPDVPKLDYALMFESDTMYFAESTHINSLGAELFTTKLAHDIDSLGFLK